MKFKISSASGDYAKYINTLNQFNYKDDFIELTHAADFMRLVKGLNCDVIVDNPVDEYSEPAITIYDAYVE